MRIFAFFLSAATLHVVLLGLSFENAGQHSDKHLVGVALVQRQWNLPHHHGGLESREMPSIPSTAEPVMTNTEHQQAEIETERLAEASIQQRVTTDETMSPPVDINRRPVALEDPVLQQPDVNEPPPEVVKEVKQIASLSSDQQVKEPTVEHETASQQASNPQTQKQTHKMSMSSQQHAVDATPSDVTGRAPQQSAQVQARPRYGYNPAPTYPSIARRRGWEGTVEFNVKVLTSGQVEDVQLKNSSGYRSLDNAARRAIMTWRFNPATQDGRSVESWVVIPVHFVLDDRPHTR